MVTAAAGVPVWAGLTAAAICGLLTLGVGALVATLTRRVLQRVEAAQRDEWRGTPMSAVSMVPGWHPWCFFCRKNRPHNVHMADPADDDKDWAP